MNYCLPQEFTDRFLKALKDGTIAPEKLVTMSSAERRNFFTDIVGEADAKQVNALLESKLLLKDQKRGMVSWAKKVAGITEPVRRDLIARIEKMDRILDPPDAHAFLQDLAAKKLGTDVSFAEAKEIAARSKEIARLSEISKNSGTKADRTKEGVAKLDLNEYVGSLVPVNKEIISNIANLPKTVMSTLDLSAALRQGWGMTSRPEFYKAFGSMLKYAVSEKAFKEMKADVITRPTYPMMKAAGLRISALAEKLSQREEAYMSTILDKVPGVRGAERAYSGFLTKLRADVFDHLIESAKLAGEHIGVGTKETKDIASVVNNFTGSGNIGTGDKYANTVPALNAAFFSPRKISATVGMLDPRNYLDPRISATARKAALRQLIGSVGFTTAVVGLAGLAGAKIENDPKSSDFMKPKFGKTRYDFTGGNGTYAVLLARLAQNATKSSTSGKSYELGTGYKPTTRGDLVVKFGRNKLSPIASFVADWLYGSDAIGTPFKASDELLQRAYPLVIQDITNVLKEDPDNLIPSILAAQLGVGVQTY